MSLTGCQVTTRCTDSLIMSKAHVRNASRVEVNLPVKLLLRPTRRGDHPNIETITPPVAAMTADAFDGEILDISMNGVFIACEPAPVLSRFLLSFTLPNYGTVRGVGLCTWRRLSDEVAADGTMLPAGMGILFEHIPLTARVLVHSLTSGEYDLNEPVTDYDFAASGQHGDQCCSDPDCHCWRDPKCATQKITAPNPEFMHR